MIDKFTSAVFFFVGAGFVAVRVTPDEKLCGARAPVRLAVMH